MLTNAISGIGHQGEKTGSRLMFPLNLRSISNICIKEIVSK